MVFFIFFLLIGRFSGASRLGQDKYIQKTFISIFFFNSGLRVTSGASFCTVDANDCVSDGAGQHGNREACTVEVLGAGTLDATEFDTESCCDHVTIGGTPYQGSTGPDGVAVAADSIFTWTSDGSVTNDGWIICFRKTQFCVPNCCQPARAVWRPLGSELFLDAAGFSGVTSMYGFSSHTDESIPCTARLTSCTA